MNAHAVTMLYRSPGKETIWGISVDHITVPDDEIDAKLSDGWHRTIHGAEEAAKVAAAEKLKANEEEQALIAGQLAGAGQGEPEQVTSEGGMNTGEGVSGGTDTAAPPETAKPKLVAVHKGRGVWELQDEAGNAVKTGLTKEEAHAAAA